MKEKLNSVKGWFEENKVKIRNFTIFGVLCCVVGYTEGWKRCEYALEHKDDPTEYDFEDQD